MAEIFTIKQHTTRPKLELKLMKNATTAINLSQASLVTLRMRGAGEVGAPKVAAPVPIASAPGGFCVYPWRATDTDTVGIFEGECHVLYDDGGTEVFPHDGTFSIVVRDDLTSG